MESFRWIWGYVKKYKVKFFLALIMVLVASAISMINPYFSGKIVDEVIKNHKRNLLLPILALMVSTTIIKSIIRYTFQIFFERVSQNSIYELRRIFIRSFRIWILNILIIIELVILWLG